MVRALARAGKGSRMDEVWDPAADAAGWVEEAEAEIQAATDPAALAAVRTRWLGRRGRLTEALRGLGELAPAARRERGQVLNRVREAVEQALAAREAALEAAARAAAYARERLDMTLPGIRPAVGQLHPLTRLRRELEDLFTRLGFSVALGPEVESEWYNFEALNMPANHPARDMQDSFFVDVPGFLLRTHTSPVQIRAMHARGGALPVKVIAPGHVYRRDDDATHSPMFTQLEGLMVDRGISLADLKGVLLTLVRALFGPGTAIRLRPSYFPFTEPSVEVDISCTVCGGSGCATCKHSGWLEILGAGMVHPLVLANGGYDPDSVSGFAFGLGLERVLLLRYGFDDLRPFYQNDLRFLQQFARGSEGQA